MVTLTPPISSSSSSSSSSSLCRPDIRVKRKDKDDYWCAGAYIINKPVLKQFVDAIFVDLAALSSARNDSSSSRSRSRFSPGLGRGPGPSHGSGSGSGSLSRVAAVKVIAGYQSPCWPKFCCNGSALAVGKGSACVHAARSGRTPPLSPAFSHSLMRSQGLPVGPLHLQSGLRRDLHARKLLASHPLHPILHPIHPIYHLGCVTVCLSSICRPCPL